GPGLAALRLIINDGLMPKKVGRVPGNAHDIEICRVRQRRLFGTSRSCARSARNPRKGPSKASRQYQPLSSRRFGPQEPNRSREPDFRRRTWAAAVLFEAART